MDLLWEASPQGKVFEGWPLETTFMRRCLENPDHYAAPRLEVTGLPPLEARRRTFQKLARDYLRTVAGIDDNVSRLLDFLDHAGLAGNTVVVYTSDQGYFLGEHNLFEKRFMLDESLRMPFILRYPGEVKPGTVNGDIITNVDFAETLLDYAGRPVLPDMQGRSFRANLRGITPEDWPRAMYYHYWTAGQPARPSHYGIRTHEDKLIYYYGLVRDRGRKPEDCWEFYDLARDPSELINRYRDSGHAARIERLREQLDALRLRCGDISDPLLTYPPKVRCASDGPGRVQ
jgi:arylsulfatase A-like enzyme